MAKRPWVTPTEVKEYTDYPAVKNRADTKLKADILRAEQHIISYTNNRFDDEAKFPEIPEPVKTAVILVAEMFAFNAAEGAEGKGNYKSETFDDYSYTLADTTAKLDNLSLGSLLDDYIITEPRNAVTMRLRKL
nr:MAG TPA: Head Tail Connector Protein [Caudoviricetes sp.]